MRMVVGPACACENGKGKKPSRTAQNELEMRRPGTQTSLALAAYRTIGDQLDGQEPVLRNVNLADAKAHLSKLVEWVAAGDTAQRHDSRTSICWACAPAMPCISPSAPITVQPCSR
jgi:hypothetical protein